MRHLLFFILTLSFSYVVKAQVNDTLKTADELDFNDDMGLEELLNVKLTVASQKELSIEQTPAIVSVLTKEDIHRSASKDLTDVLRLIPGFEFAADVNSEIGLGVRGINAIEGKVLLMIDGLQMNENLYGTSQWIGRFDINQIEKIEIIRGPGYAAYNGFASLGVINIITKKAKDIQGIEAHATYSRLGNSLGRQQLSVTSGWQKKNWGIKGSLYTGELYRSEGVFFDHEKSVVMNTNKNNYVTTTQFYITTTYKYLEIKYFHEDYKTRTPFHLDSILHKPGMSSFLTRQIDVNYKWNVSNKLTIIPRVNFNYNRPYLSNDYNDSTNTDPGYFVFDHDNYRLSTNIASQYKLKEHIQINFGLGYFHDKAEKHLSSYSPLAADTDSILGEYQDINDYLELFFQKPSYTASLGMRHEYHSVFGNVFLPRLAFTKQYKKFSFKAAYSHAFRAPLAENLVANSTLKPEITKVGEIQIGYKLTNNLNLSVNAFDNHISNVIVYDVINNEDNFFNFSKLGTRGVETEFLYHKKNFTLGGNYSYYVKTQNDVLKYDALNSKQFLAFSPHKLTISSQYTFIEKITFNSSFVLIGKRYAYTAGDGVNHQQTIINPTGILNFTLSYYSKQNKGLGVQLGLYDILDSKYLYVQAYNGDKNPFRATGREIALKLSYTFSKK